MYACYDSFHLIILYLSKWQEKVLKRKKQLPTKAGIKWSFPEISRQIFLINQRKYKIRESLKYIKF
jgi:hypothetical protein